MHFLVSFRHKASWLTYLILAEPDAIFIAFPQIWEQTTESIFLLKTDKGWIGDTEDKLLVEHLGQQIDIRSSQPGYGPEQQNSKRFYRRRQDATGPKDSC